LNRLWLKNTNDKNHRSICQNNLRYEQLMVEKYINDDQDDHWHTHQPAYEILTHDTSPLMYPYNDCLL